MKSLIGFYCVFSVLLHSNAGCNVELVTPEQWGARQPKGNESMQMPVSHIFLHHTATGACDTKSSCSTRMRGMQNYHMDDKGWNDIGYNFVIGGDGRVYVGRGWDSVGAHTYGFNRKSVAFSLIGNFVEEVPSSTMLNATKEMIKCARSQNHVKENFKLHGHRDGSCTECPGQALYDVIKTWDRFEAGPLPGYSCRT